MEPQESIDEVGGDGHAGASAPTMAEQFKEIFREHPAGVAVITGDDGTGPAGLTATSVVSVSPEPPLVTFVLSSHSSATPVLGGADAVVVHFLGSGQVELARRFATRGADRFGDATNWRRLPTGEPVLHGVNGWMRTVIFSQYGIENATLVIARVASVHMASDRSAPLLYRNRNWYALSQAKALV